MENNKVKSDYAAKQESLGKVDENKNETMKIPPQAGTHMLGFSFIFKC